MGAPDLETVLAEARQAVAENRAATTAARQLRLADETRSMKTDDEVAARRRHGDDGADWQALQQRIDLKKTTLPDILNGMDLSREARSVRELATKNLPVVRAQFSAAVEEAEKSGELAGFERSRADLARSIAELDALDLNL